MGPRKDRCALALAKTLQGKAKKGDAGVTVSKAQAARVKTHPFLWRGHPDLPGTGTHADQPLVGSGRVQRSRGEQEKVS